MADTLELLWEGVDGSVWSLLDRSSPVQVTALDGLGLPQFTQQFATSSARDGRRYEGTTWGENTVTMTVTVGDPRPRGRRRGDQWRALDGAWWSSLSPENTGQLVVVSGAGRRSLKLRLDQAPPPPPGRNPALSGEATYTLQLTADDQPWWAGEKVEATFGWSEGIGEPFFGGPDGEVLLFISAQSETDTSAIANPGDRAVFPDWWARGPFDSLRLGLGDRTVLLPFAREDGQMVFIDSAAQTITDENGVSLWPLMGFEDPTFAPIPSGGRVPLVTELENPGPGSAVGVSLTPLHRRPW